MLVVANAPGPVFATSINTPTSLSVLDGTCANTITFLAFQTLSPVVGSSVTGNICLMNNGAGAIYIIHSSQNSIVFSGLPDGLSSSWAISNSTFVKLTPGRTTLVDLVLTVTGPIISQQTYSFTTTVFAYTSSVG